MRVTYINLDRETARRRALEENFAATNSLGWTLSRYAAVDGATLNTAALGTTLGASESACFLSHRAAIEESRRHAGHAMITEDDVLFGPSSQRMVMQAIRSLPPHWDLLYTDVCIPNIQSMIELFLLRRERGGRSTLVPLRGLPFAGATAYIVNERTKQRLADLFVTSGIQMPYDLWLRQLVYDGTLAAYATFPFVTTLSAHAESSQIQSTQNSSILGIWNAFRRLMWYDADPVRAASPLRSVDLEAMRADELELLSMLASVITGKCGVTWIPGIGPASQ
jgi:GR25 family glycosyltransferase involved in LPS biosynthesis